MDQLNDRPVSQKFKVLLLGDTGVGKTSLLHHYKKRPSVTTDNTSLMSTIGWSLVLYQCVSDVILGIDFSEIMVTVRGIRIQLSVW
jgi:GTPase SAR1 family protein